MIRHAAVGTELRVSLEGWWRAEENGVLAERTSLVSFGEGIFLTTSPNKKKSAEHSDGKKI